MQSDPKHLVLRQDLKVLFRREMVQRVPGPRDMRSMEVKSLRDKKQMDLKPQDLHLEKVVLF